jgi:electron transfer flavoprotein alpha subunit
MSVLVYTQNWDGKFKKSSFELVSYAAKVAEMTNTSVTALSIGSVDETELKKLGNYGAGKILNVNNEYCKVLDNQVFTSIISQVAVKENSDVIVLSNNNEGKAIAPRLSVRLKAGIGSGVSKLPVNQFTCQNTYSCAELI